ncbi:GNAT family N-acetyltransferase [Opitutaceae bacterium EW11]|nr:GNAT family N-acetyltransferase [Opitutaceae bacterium EW11]
MEIREASVADLSEAARLSAEVFMEAVAPLYSAEGTRVFLDYASVAAWRERHERGQRTWLALDQSRMIGVLHIRDGNHVSMFFVDTAHQRHGIGRCLLRHAIAELGVGEFTVNSSPNSVAGYEKLGFAATGPEEEKFGIRFTPMKGIFRIGPKQSLEARLSTEQ